MSLYCVYPRNGDWCCFVFAETRNRARALLVGYFDDEDGYIDFGARCVKKGVNGSEEICDVDCGRLASLGVQYVNEEV